MNSKVRRRKSKRRRSVKREREREREREKRGFCGEGRISERGMPQSRPIPPSDGSHLPNLLRC